MAGRPDLARSGDLAIFDLARAAAALAVLAAHARSFLLLDVKDQPALSAFGQVVYGATALGHQAVVVFFVISGTLVTRSMMALEASGQWSARRFAAARLTRLWAVLLPCLVLGGCLDRLGLAIGDQLVYAGHYGALQPAAPPAAVRLDLTTFLVNVAFLQTIAGPPYGTNVPLWSLANEAWYYVAAFLVWSAWRERGRPGRAAAFLVGLALVLGWVLTPDMRALAPTWVIGAILAPCLPSRRGRGVAPPGAEPWLPRCAVLTLLALAIGAARVNAIGHPLLGDTAVALATALCLFVFRDWPPAPSVALAATRRIAGFSYSLYLSHFPLLALLAAVGLRNRRLPFGIESMGLLLAASALALIYAAGLWWCFERRTGQLRVWIARTAAPKRSGRLAPSLAGQGERAR